MGMKKSGHAIGDSGPAGLDVVIPPVPSLPKTSVAPKSDPNGVSPVAPTIVSSGFAGIKKWEQNGDKGLGKVLDKDNTMSKADWQNKDKGISIDAIHKSTLESPTLANLAIGKNDDEVLALTRKFFKYQLETNQLAKRGEL